MRKWIICPAMLALALLAMPTRAGAATVDCSGGVNLATLISSGDSCQEGDKVFSDFTFLLQTNTGFVFPTDASGITVTTTTVNGLEGLTFGGAFNATGIGTTSALDILLTYTVSSLDGLISDIHLDFNGSGTLPFSTSVTETVVDPTDNTTIGQAVVTNPPPVLNANVDLSRLVDTALVRKDIQLIAFTGGTATISFIDQLVSQVPEPGTMLMFGLGLLGVGKSIRRRRQSQA